jgi:NADPH-dependent FMN reductase
MLDHPRIRKRPLEKPKATETRPLRVLLVAGSARRVNGCPGLDSKARFLMQRMAARLPPGWQIDTEDIGNQHGKPKIQGCNGCVSSSMALCVWPCNCYGPKSDTQPDLMWDLDLYGRLARADAWAFIGPIWWYGPSTNFKTMFDRLVCMNGGNPRPDLIDKKSTLLAQALERSSQWQELSKNHLEGRSAAFFCYGDKGGADLDKDGRPKNLEHKEWFDPEQEPNNCDGREAYQGLVWQCRYSGIEVPDILWDHCDFGVGKLYADDQADDIVRDDQAALVHFDRWADAFIGHVRTKGLVPGTEEAMAGAKSITNL